MLKFKGLEGPRAIIALMFFVAWVISISMFFSAHFIKPQGSFETPTENIEAYEAAYFVRSCFENSSVIYTDTLDNLKGDITDICGIPYPPIEATVKDIENGREWKFKMPSIAKLKKYFGWLINELKIWGRRHVSSTHDISVPIAYRNMALGKDDIIFKNDGNYLMKIKFSDMCEVVEIKEMLFLFNQSQIIVLRNKKSLTQLEKRMSDMYDKHAEGFIMVNSKMDVKVGDISFVRLAERRSDCLSKKRLYIIKEGEVHVGLLHVRV